MNNNYNFSSAKTKIKMFENFTFENYAVILFFSLYFFNRTKHVILNDYKANIN